MHRQIADSWPSALADGMKNKNQKALAKIE
jgi:hypothetical protein